MRFRMVSESARSLTHASGRTDTTLTEGQSIVVSVGEGGGVRHEFELFVTEVHGRRRRTASVVGWPWARLRA